MRFLALLILSALIATCGATTYEVGPSKPYTTIGQVPWESLNAGDLVLIHWRATPYFEKWVLCRQGTAENPIIVRGVPGAGGQLPIIDGNGAITRLALNYASEQRGIIKIGSANIPADTMPKHIVIENLDIRGAHTPNTFTDESGVVVAYSGNASAIYVEKGENITVRNCIMHDCGNGFFVASNDDEASRNILIEGNFIYDNGNVGSNFEHNNYTAAIGITFQYNHFGLPKTGAGGNNLKDRSAGLVVRYNWIEGGNRQLDLVEGDDSSLIRTDPSYANTHVYGNVLIEPAGAGNRQIVHYGGDNGNETLYRKGTLHFYNNTVVSTRTDRTNLFRLSTNDEHCDARNNIFYITNTGSNLSILDDTGFIQLSHNWFKPGWVNGFVAISGTVMNDGTSVQGAAPGFVNEAAQDFSLASTSACVNAGTGLNAAVLPTHNVVRHYRKHQQSESRPVVSTPDIGAIEFSRVEAWRISQFGSNAADPLIAGDLADPDRDSLANIVEYALGLNPLQSSSAHLPATLDISGTPYFSITFARRPPPAEVTYFVECSDDLTLPWNPGPSYTDLADTTSTAYGVEHQRAGTDPLQITIPRATPITGSSRQFLRLRITRP